jgi:hypothetical protein
MATDPSETVPAPQPEANQAPSLDDALSGMTVDDALAGMQPESDTSAYPPGAPGRPDTTVSNLAVPGTVIGSPAESAMLGAAKAGIELKDFLFGEPNQGDKWAIRQFIEDRAKGLRGNSSVNGVAEGVSQFGVGFMGLGKIKYVAKGIEAAKNAGSSLTGQPTLRGVPLPAPSSWTRTKSVCPTWCSPIRRCAIPSPTTSPRSLTTRTQKAA